MLNKLWHLTYKNGKTNQPPTTPLKKLKMIFCCYKVGIIPENIKSRKFSQTSPREAVGTTGTWKMISWTKNE